MAPLTLWFVLVLSVANVAVSATGTDEAESCAAVNERAALTLNLSTRPALFGAEAVVEELLGEEDAAVCETAAYSVLTSVNMTKKTNMTEFVKKRSAEAKHDGNWVIPLIVASALVITCLPAICRKRCAPSANERSLSMLEMDNIV